MERIAAIKKLGKILGSKFGYRINRNAATPEERIAAKADLVKATELAEELRTRREARYKELLQDTQYQSLVATSKEARDKRDKLLGIIRSHKITVGVTVAGMFFQVKAEGDSWEEVIDKLTKEKTAA